MFNEIARQLRQPTGILGKILSKFLKRMNGDIYKQMVKELAAQDGEKIYEIGYGHGSGINQVAQAANCEVNGIDFSEVMYNDAVKLNADLITNKKVTLTFGDFLTTEIDAGYYDKIFCVNVIYFWSDLLKPFAKIKNSLTAKGIFYIYMDSLEEIKNSKFTNESSFNFYDMEQVRSQLNEIGFEVSHYDYGRGHILKCSVSN